MAGAFNDCAMFSNARCSTGKAVVLFTGLCSRLELSISLTLVDAKPAVPLQTGSMSRWLAQFEAQHPTDRTKTWTVGVAERKIKLLRANGHEVKLARAMLLGKVLSEPLVIGKGWCRFEKEDCLIYAGKTGIDYRSRTIEVPPPPGCFFLAFILPDGTIDDWAWRPASETNSDVPSDITGDILWPTN